MANGEPAEWGGFSTSPYAAAMQQPATGEQEAVKKQVQVKTVKAVSTEPRPEEPAEDATFEHSPMGTRVRLRVLVVIGAVLVALIVTGMIVGWSSQWFLQLFSDPAAGSDIVVDVVPN